jgi:hypothetical protein
MMMGACAVFEDGEDTLEDEDRSAVIQGKWQL